MRPLRIYFGGARGYQPTGPGPTSPPHGGTSVKSPAEARAAEIRARDRAQVQTLIVREASALRRRLHQAAAADQLEPQDCRLLIALDEWALDGGFTPRRKP